jgi:hypothetical protein
VIGKSYAQASFAGPVTSVSDKALEYRSSEKAHYKRSPAGPAMTGMDFRAERRDAALGRCPGSSNAALDLVSLEVVIFAPPRPAIVLP